MDDKTSEQKETQPEVQTGGGVPRSTGYSDLPVARKADGGGIPRALFAGFGALLFFAISIGFIVYGVQSLQDDRTASDDSGEAAQAGAETAESDDATDDDDEKSDDSEDSDSPSELELVSAVPFPDVIGNVYVFCMVKYTGSRPGSFIRVDAHLLDAAGDEVARGFGYTPLQFVQPGQTVPVSVLVKKPGEYSRIRTSLSFKPVEYPPAQATLSAHNVVMTAAPAIYVEGKITNSGNQPAANAHAVAVVFDADGKGCGAGSGYVPSKVLAPGATEPFKAYIHPQKCKPVRFEVFPEAIIAR